MIQLISLLAIFIYGPINPDNQVLDIPLKELNNVLQNPIDDSIWGKLLKQHVDDHGNVDYKHFLKDTTLLNSYIANMSKNPPAAKSPKNERLAYYINLYNAATVKLILDHYPLKSIKDIKNPWDNKWVAIGDKLYSLGDIEHGILRKMGEPRIHFAINCASYSCPKLFNHVYTAANMDQQLEDAARSFINDPKRNMITAEQAKLSEIFKWYKKDFTTTGSLTDFINKYAKTKITSTAKISYLNYDWQLNEAK